MIEKDADGETFYGAALVSLIPHSHPTPVASDVVDRYVRGGEEQETRKSDLEKSDICSDNKCILTLLFSDNKLYVNFCDLTQIHCFSCIVVNIKMWL